MNKPNTASDASPVMDETDYHRAKLEAFRRSAALWRHKAACFDEILAALESCERDLDHIELVGEPNDIEKALSVCRSAIRKAKGGKA